MLQAGAAVYSEEAGHHVEVEVEAGQRGEQVEALHSEVRPWAEAGASESLRSRVQAGRQGCRGIRGFTVRGPGRQAGQGQRWR